MLKNYVEFLSPGAHAIEHSVKEIPERDAKKVELSDTCFGFRFFDRTVINIDGETFTGERKNVSGWYYIGKKLTLKKLKAAFGNDENYRTLIFNMEIREFNAVVETKFGYFIPLHDDDKVL